MYAAGKIPGSFFRREGRPGEQAILTCRLTDRPLRPSFPADFRNEVQVIATILGADLENPHDVASINGASAALTVSGIPFDGPIGAVRLAHHDGEWIAHPTYQEGDESTFEIVVAGRQLDDGDVAIMMVEAGGTERTWELYEAGRPEGDRGGHRRGPRGVEAVDRRVDRPAARAASPRSSRRTARSTPIEYKPRVDYPPDVFDAVADRRTRRRHRRGDGDRRQDRPQRRGSTRSSSRRHRRARRHPDETPGAFAEPAGEVKKAFRSLQKEVVRKRIVNEGVRIDGRGADRHPAAVGRGRHPRRPRTAPACSSGARPRCCRSPRSACRAWSRCSTRSRIDDRKRYMHHYNFPPFSTGETGRVGSPKRREIGHGALAERALRAGAAEQGRSGRTRCASSPTCSRRTAPRRWRRSAARRCR